jgi:triacylglycerol lipase
MTNDQEPMTVPKLGAPIVLVHGLLGITRVEVGKWRLASYFPGIPEMLRASGNRVLVPQLSLTAGVAERAAQLKDFLDREAPGEAIHLIAHSMGGLDSRYLISRLGLARVLTLTTIATPHRGTAFADWGVRRLERIVTPILDWFGIPQQAFHDLTTARCREFNEQVPDTANVRYFSVAGRHEGTWWSPEWVLPHQIVLEAEGPNDGVVSVASANYGEGIEVWQGDHLSLVNMSNSINRALGPRPDRLPDYAALVRRLADEGY